MDEDASEGEVTPREGRLTVGEIGSRTAAWVHQGRAETLSAAWLRDSPGSEEGAC